MSRGFMFKLGAAAIAGAIALATQAADAVTIYGLMTTPASGAGTSRLVTFDSATPGNFTILGNSIANDPFPGGLEFDGAGNLYASNHGSGNFFFSVNPVNGASTLIGGSGLHAGYQITDLSWDADNGRMLALATLGQTNTAPRLYSVNTATGALTNIGDVTGVNDGVDVSLAVRGDGRIFLHGLVTDRWYSVDQNTLAATPLAPLPFDSNFGQGGTFDLNDGTLYHAAFNATAFQGQLWTINPATGAAVFVGVLGTNVDPLVQITDIAIRVIPEPGSMALAGLSGLALLRRRR